MYMYFVVKNNFNRDYICLRIRSVSKSNAVLIFYNMGYGLVVEVELKQFLFYKIYFSIIPHIM